MFDPMAIGNVLNEQVEFYRHIRIFGMSSLELSLTFIVIGIIVHNRNTKTWKKMLIEFIQWTVLFFTIAIFVNWLFDVNTALNCQLGLSKCSLDMESMTGIFNDCTNSNFVPECTNINWTIIKDCNNY